MNIVIIGGHGKVALRLAKTLAAASHSVISVIRDPSHSESITSIGATPKLLSLEDAPASDFSQLFESSKTDLVYFSAGAGGKGGEERTKKVDYEGAVKIFDAIEQVKGEKKPYLVLVSGVDVRNADVIPPHYNEKDIETSKMIRKAIPAWIKWKYEADLNLSKRTTFKWFVLRPGGLLDSAGAGKGAFGRTHLQEQIARDDVAQVLSLFASQEKQDAAAGLMLDMVGGDSPLEEGLDAAISRGETAFYP